MVNINLDKLTTEEKAKIERIVRMIKDNEKKIYIEEVRDLSQQIAFIRKHAGKKYPFYSDEWYLDNPKRTRALYYKTRNEYVKEFRIEKRKILNARDSLRRLLEKATDLVEA